CGIHKFVHSTFYYPAPTIASPPLLLLTPASPTDHATLSLHDALPILMRNHGHAVGRIAAERSNSVIEAPFAHRSHHLPSLCDPYHRVSSFLTRPHVLKSYGLYCLYKIPFLFR